MRTRTYHSPWLSATMRYRESECGCAHSHKHTRFDSMHITFYSHIFLFLLWVPFIFLIRRLPSSSTFFFNMHFILKNTVFNFAFICRDDLAALFLPHKKYTKNNATYRKTSLECHNCRQLFSVEKCAKFYANYHRKDEIGTSARRLNHWLNVYL